MKWRFISIAAFLLLAQPTWAESLVSPNYQIDESFVGGGGRIEESSTNFKAAESIGDIGIGDSASGNFQTSSGYTTSSDPALTFIVNTSMVNFGSISVNVASTAISSFSVINYTSYGYIVQSIGNPPSNGAYTLNGMSSPSASQVGAEQYGINLRANTSPAAQGANPLGGFGAATGGYNSPNQYKYVPGDTIASAAKSSGKTDFTISYIVNASPGTPGGDYTGTQTLVCTGTY